MQFLDCAAAVLADWRLPEVFAFDIVKQLLAAPLLLVMIIVIHYAYFRWNRSTVGQQIIALTDLSDLNAQDCLALSERLTLVQASQMEFDARDRASVPVRMALPLRASFAAVGHASCHANSLLIAGRTVGNPLVCAEDLVVDGSCQFLGAVKVGGDLIVRGNATFFEAVIVNGVLKVEGEAQFAIGVLAKGDTFISGAVTIGSEQAKGWAALRQLALRTRLRLNGRIVTRRAVQVREAA